MAIKDTLIDVRLHQMQPLLVGKYSEIIQGHLKAALAGQKGSPNSIRNLMLGVHRGDIHVWLIVTGEGADKKIVGMVFTQVANDPFLETRRLVIYGLNMKAQATPESISSCLETLTYFAKRKGCYAMSAQTAVAGIRKLLDRSGWTAITTHTKEI